MCHRLWVMLSQAGGWAGASSGLAVPLPHVVPLGCFLWESRQDSQMGTSLVVQWVRLQALNARGLGSGPG